MASEITYRNATDNTPTSIPNLDGNSNNQQINGHSITTGFANPSFELRTSATLMTTTEMTSQAPPIYRDAVLVRRRSTISYTNPLAAVPEHPSTPATLNEEELPPLPSYEDLFRNA